MGGARNLKFFGATWGQGPGHRGRGQGKWLWVDKMYTRGHFTKTNISPGATEKGGKGKSIGGSPPTKEVFGATWGQWAWAQGTREIAMSGLSTRGHFTKTNISPRGNWGRGQRQEHRGQFPPLPPLAPPMFRRVNIANICAVSSAVERTCCTSWGRLQRQRRTQCSASRRAPSVCTSTHWLDFAPSAARLVAVWSSSRSLPPTAHSKHRSN